MTDSFGNTFDTPAAKLVYGIASLGDLLFLAASDSPANKVWYKFYYLNSTHDPDTDVKLTKVTNQMTATSSVTYQPISIAFTKVTVYTLSAGVATVFPVANPSLNSIASYNSSGT